MESKFALALICCVLAGACSAQGAPGKQEQMNLDFREGADYFHFPEGAQLKVTQLSCPSGVAVVVTCRTGTHARCGSWRLGLNGTATAGSKAVTGIANIDYSGSENCTARVVVQSP